MLKTDEVFNQMAGYYSKRYENSTIENIGFIARADAVVKMTCHIAGEILDIGCGAGDITFKLERKDRIITGIDIAEDMISIAQKRNHNSTTTFLKMDAKNIDFKNENFNMITMVGVIEYIENLDKVIVEANRVLKSGGCLLITSPNGINLNRWLEELLSPIKYIAYKLKIKNQEPDGKIKHRCRLTFLLDKKIEKLGFKKTDSYYHHFLFHPFNVITKTFSLKLCMKMDKMRFNKIFGFLFAGNYIAVYTKVQNYEQ